MDTYIKRLYEAFNGDKEIVYVEAPQVIRCDDGTVYYMLTIVMRYKTGYGFWEIDNERLDLQEINNAS